MRPSFFQGRATFTIATRGMYVIGIKYDTKSIAGAVLPEHYHLHIQHVARQQQRAAHAQVS